MIFSSLLAVWLLVIVAGIVGIFFAIKYFVRYNAKMRKKKSQQQEELDRMKIDDL
jgi:uncharacterized membrane-anchored protein YhcB (DUF1043 family)